MYLGDNSASFSSSGFYKMLANGHFAAIRCKSCRIYVVPPTSICSHCLSTNLEWRDLSRKGKVLTFSEVHVTSEEFRDRIPYVVAIVETDEGIRFPGILKDADLESVSIGTPVEVHLEIQRTGGKLPGYYFSLLKKKSTKEKNKYSGIRKGLTSRVRNQ